MGDREKDSDDPSLQTLELIKFNVAMSPNGLLSVERSRVPSNGNRETDDTIRMIMDGTEQKLNSFFEAWKPFVLFSVFPDPSSVYKIEEDQQGYRIHAKDGDLDSTVAMRKDLTVTQISANSKGLSGKTDPEFLKSDRGLLVNKLDSDINGGKVKSTITIQYQDVEGLKLPRTVVYDSVINEENQIIELIFSDYKIKKR